MSQESPRRSRTDKPRRWTALVTILGLAASSAIGLARARAQAFDEERFDKLESVIHRIAGGAAILSDLSSSDAARDLDESARRLEQLISEGATSPRRMANDWRRLREAYSRLNRERNSRDPRMQFVLGHLGQDLAMGDRIVGRDVSGDYSDRPFADSVRHAVILDQTTCIGWNIVGPHPCPSPRREMTFRLPRDATHIRKISGEWRDYGRGARAQVYVDKNAVWETDVAKGWDSDGRDLDVRVWPGSTITLVSKNGDPMWVRKFEIDYQRE
jgi:hypothetical protein